MNIKNVFGVALGIWLFLSGTAHAGMPMINLSDMAALRINNISFFLFIILIASFGLQKVWNYLQKDFKKLPRLNYKKSVGFVVLWGLAFYLVLAMIAGTREIMTPKAWEKAGLTYDLNGGGGLYQSAVEQNLEDGSLNELLSYQRHDRLKGLKGELWIYAKSHKGAFPPTDQVAEIPDSAWHIHQASTQRFVYLPGEKINNGKRLIAYEPEIYGQNRLALFSNGAIEYFNAP
ncbi:MAG: hypothetical protein IIA62_07545 [Nitrospinae bacterium]|nr:hypothetical protein [Nitrospinota bacterium]